MSDNIKTKPMRSYNDLMAKYDLTFNELLKYANSYDLDEISITEKDFFDTLNYIYTGAVSLATDLLEVLFSDLMNSLSRDLTDDLFNECASDLVSNKGVTERHYDFYNDSLNDVSKDYNDHVKNKFFSLYPGDIIAVMHPATASDKIMEKFSMTYREYYDDIDMLFDDDEELELVIRKQFSNWLQKIYDDIVFNALELVFSFSKSTRITIDEDFITAFAGAMSILHGRCSDTDKRLLSEDSEVRSEARIEQAILNVFKDTDLTRKLLKPNFNIV